MNSSYNCRPDYRYLQASKAMSLIEILIAVSILVGSVLALIMSFRRSGMDHESFSSERFTAMFLAQKVIEDIQDRITVNPYFFGQLLASATGEPLPVIDGKSPYFRLMENSAGFTKLLPEEDDPIVASSGSIYDQLKTFSCQVIAEPVMDPANPMQPMEHLMQVKVIISWVDKTHQSHSYEIMHMVYGFNREYMKKIQSQKMVEPFKDKDAISALYKWLGKKSKKLTWSAFKKYNDGGDERVLKPLGAMVAGLLEADALNKEYKEALDKARAELAKLSATKKITDIAKLKEHVARLREQMALSALVTFSRLESDLKVLSAAVIDKYSLGKRVYKKRKNFAQIPLVLMNHLMKISINFALAETAYKELLYPPHPGVALNRRIPLIHQWLDIRKLGILMADQWNLNVSERLAGHQKTLNSLMKIYLGRKPMFISYLLTEKNVASTITSLKAELAALSRQISLSMGVSGHLSMIRKKLRAAK